MGTLVAAYVIVWVAVSLYVARLGVVQRRLEKRIQALQADGAKSGQLERSRSKAA